MIRKFRLVLVYAMIASMASTGVAQELSLTPGNTADDLAPLSIERLEMPSADTNSSAGDAEESAGAAALSDESGGLEDHDAAATPDRKTYMVRLTSEGSVDGRIRVTYPTGKTEPLGAKVSFAKNGEVVESTETDESGRFRLAGLNPGDYVATADAMTGTHADFDVRVLPFNEGALAEEMFLDATLTPLPGYVGEGCATCGEEVIVDEVVMDGGEFCGEAIVEDYAMAAPMGIAGDCGATCGGGFAGGGCCGGARGFGWLGLAGLAGLAGLGGKDSTPVSPYSHHYRGY